jgi:hypothetical protein
MNSYIRNLFQTKQNFLLLYKCHHTFLWFMDMVLKLDNM